MIETDNILIGEVNPQFLYKVMVVNRLLAQDLFDLACLHLKYNQLLIIGLDFGSWKIYKQLLDTKFVALANFDIVEETIKNIENVMMTERRTHWSSPT